ncbi:hypothetical protein A0H81_04417 [Grifola frondosa]|uniref:Uncharacterized protein n=1 Tax=Grifola frondosa TaxID=5627 RepID=A0A1C7MHA5_GRIFR|nr:hypothetical protein A0H81_04417 [Grifola frondosa]
MFSVVQHFAPAASRLTARYAIHDILPKTASRRVATASSPAHSNSPATSVVRPKWAQRSPSPGMAQTSHWGFLNIATGNKEIEKQNTAEDVWKRREKTLIVNLPKPHNPYSGRTSLVLKRGVVNSFAKLRMTMLRNNVRADNIGGERHEKKGVKRNRLRADRWRRLFAHEVRKKVQLVNQIRARGA